MPAVLPRLLSLLLALTLIAGLAACGDDDDKGASTTETTESTAANPPTTPGTPTTPTTPGTPATPGGPDEAQIRKTLDEYTTAFVGGDGEATCALLTDAARAQLEQAAAGKGAGEDCVSIITAAAKTIPAEQKQQLENINITTVKVDGDTATVEIEGGTGAGKLEKVDGRWLIAGDVGG